MPGRNRSPPRGRKSKRFGRRRVGILAGAATATIVAVLIFISTMHGASWKPPIEISHVYAPDFTLTDQSGHSFDLQRNASGKAVAIYFGYTHCPDVCPGVMKKFAAVISSLGPDASKIRLIMVTTDPWRDSPQVLNSFISRFNPNIVGLTGSVDQVSRVWGSYGVPPPELSFPNGTKVTDPTQTPGYLENHFAIIYFANADHVMSFALTPELSTDDFIQGARQVISGG